MAAESAPPTGSAPMPLVSIVVRSMGRPELRGALEALARQDHPRLDIVVVDATGGGHPPLPDLAWHAGHEVRLIASGARLPRPHAANLGLREARGEWFGFLDDDDGCDPSHVSALLAAAAQCPSAPAVYGRSRFLDADGTVRMLFGEPFNPLRQFHRPLFCWQAALFRRRVLDVGCRCDEAFDVCEDRDFVAQVAMHGTLVQVPVTTFNFRPDLGTSGTGAGVNRNAPRMVRFEQLLRAKWAGAFVAHTEQMDHVCRRAERAREAGNSVLARALYLRVLTLYRDEPRPLAGLAELALAEGDLEQSDCLARRALEVAGPAPLVLALLDRVATRRGGTEAPRVIASRVAVSRSGTCPCGSGLRYKECCGRLPDASEAASVEAAALEAALDRGDIDSVERRLGILAGQAAISRFDALAAGRIALRLGALDRAQTLLESALASGGGSDARQLLEQCWRQLNATVSRAAQWQAAAALAERINARARAGQPDRIAMRIHIVGDLRPGRRDRSAAFALHFALTGSADVSLWSVVPFAAAADADTPQIGTLDAPTAATFRDDTVVLLEADDPPGDWLDVLAAHRIVLRMRSDDPQPLLRRLAQVELCPLPMRVAIAVPGVAARARCGADAAVEYPWIDLAQSPMPRPTSRSLVIGRHGASPPSEHAAADLALYRELIARGHRLRILGGEPLHGFYDEQRRDEGMELLPADAEDTPTFLGGLDVYLYRRGPVGQRDGDARVLDAMGAGRPVVVFEDALGARELIDSGRTGCVVASNAEALAAIDRLAGDAALRHAIGAAARGRVEELMTAQRERARRFYPASGAPPEDRSADATSASA